MASHTAKSLTGWFVAPATGMYRFWMACGSACSLSVGTNPDKVERVKILNLKSAVPRGSYF